MGIIEAFVSKLAVSLADRVFEMVQARFNKAMEYDRIYSKHDQKKNELAEELAQADTQEERDAILRKIYNARPSFK